MNQLGPNFCEALLNVFDEGVIVCRRDGTVVMHNKRAVQLLAQRVQSPAGASAEVAGASPEGAVDDQLKDRSVFTFIDRALLADTLASLTQHSEAGCTGAVFATPLQADQLLRVHVSPVPVADDGTEHFVLHLRRMRPWREVDGARHQFLQALSEGLRSPLASVRAAIETMTEYPDMNPSVAEQFKNIILEQAVILSERLDDALDEYAEAYRNRWPLSDMAGRDLLALLHAQLVDQVAVPIEVASPDEADRKLLRVRVDPQALAAAMLFLAQRVVNAVQCDRLTLGLQPVERGIALDLKWTGEGVSRERLAKWTVEAIHVGDTIITMTLREILDRHRADVWSLDVADGAAPRIRLLLPYK